MLGDHEGFPVESLCLSPDRRLLASISHDDKVRSTETALQFLILSYLILSHLISSVPSYETKVRFWDMSMFADDCNDEEGERGDPQTAQV